MGIIHCNLRVLMAERGLNIQKVKDKTTLSRTTISNLYNNYGSGIQYDTLAQLCKLLNCQPGDLFKYHDIAVEFDCIRDDKTSIVDSEYFEDISNTSNRFEYYSSISKKLTLSAKIFYEGEIQTVTLDCDLYVNINENKKLSSLSGIAYSSIKLENLNYPFFILDYIKEQLTDYILDWFTENYQEEIQGIECYDTNIEYKTK